MTTREWAPWPDDIHMWTWPVFPGCIQDVQKWTSYVKDFESYGLTDIQTDRQFAHGHFRSRDKNGSHTIRSAVFQNPVIHANLMALSFIEPELIGDWSLHCGNRHFRRFRLQWPWPWPDDLHIRTSCCMEIYQMCKYELPTSNLSKVIVWQTHTHTYIHTIRIDLQTYRIDRNYKPRRFSCGHVTAIFAKRACKVAWSAVITINLKLDYYNGCYPFHQESNYNWKYMD